MVDSAPPPVDSRLEIVGRDEELAVLRTFLERLQIMPAALVLDGEPGVGKTTVWQAGVDAARESGIVVLAAAPSEGETSMTFAALDDMLSGAVDEALPLLPAPQRRALQVALLLAEADEAPPDEHAVAAAFLSILRTLAASTPVLVAIDDIHWLDASSGRVLSYALRRLREERIGALLTRRAGGDSSVLTVPTNHVSTQLLVLEPLTTGALHKLIRTRLGLVLTRPVLRRVHEASRGNPFYALELAQAVELERAELSAGTPFPVPPTLRELLRGRVDSLPAETRLALVYAASGRTLRASTLELALGVETRVALGPAVAARLVEVHGDRIRFLHPLLAEAAYAGADEQLRRQVHLRLAEVTADADERALHLALAADRPDEVVAEALERVAADARARGASATAAQLCEQARLLTPPTEADDWHRRTVAGAWYWFAAGDTARAHQLLEEALERAPPGTRRAEAMTGLGRLAITEGDQPGAADLLQRALAEAGDDAVRAEAAQSYATALFFMREELESARSYEQLATELAGRAGNVPVYLNALASKGLIEALLGRREARATLEAAVRAATEPPDERVIAWPSHHFAYYQLWSDEPADAEVALRSLVQEATTRGDESSLATVSTSLAQASFLLGRWDEALRHAEDAYEFAIQVGQRHQLAWSLSARALVLAAMGSEAQARSDAAEALTIAGDRSMGVARIQAVWALGTLELSLDRHAEAARILGPVRRRLLLGGVAEPGSMRFVGDETEAYIALGRIEDAHEPLAWLEERGHSLGRASALGVAARCRGLVLGAAGELERALAAFEESLCHTERTGNPFEAARTLLALGSVQRRAKRKADARMRLEQARSRFEALGAAIWTQKAEAELARIGGRAPSHGELTPSERRVVELVAEGKSNKEVAAALFVSTRTVEFHLSRAYRKLGVRSRSELARTFRQ